MYVKLKCLLCLLLLTLSAQAAETKTLVPIHEWQTSNGVRVLWVPLTEQPIIDIQVLFRAGSAQDGPQFGLANLTANTLEEGTTHLSADQIAQNFDNVAAQYAATTSRDATTLALRSLSADDYLDPSLKTFAALINEANFPQQAITRVKNETLQGIAAQEQSPDGMALLTFYKNLYGTHPYAHNVLGDKNTVQAITKADVENFYKHYYNASNALVVIVGNVNEAKVQRIAQQLVGQLPKGQKAPAIPAPTELNASKDITVPFPTTQTSIRMGTLGIARLDPDFYSLYVGNYVLGGGSLVSRLFKDVREKQGLTYAVNSTFVPLQEKGPFAIGLQTQNVTREKAIETVNNTLNNFIAQGPSESELNLAKKNIIGSFPLMLSGNANISNAVAIIAFYDLPLDYLDQYRNRIAAVTLKDINEAINSHLKGKPFVTVAVTEEDKATHD